MAMKLMKRRKGVAVLIPVAERKRYIVADLGDAASHPGSLVGSGTAHLVLTRRS